MRTCVCVRQEGRGVEKGAEREGSQLVVQTKHTLTNQGLHVLRGLIHVEQLPGAQGVRQGVVQLAQVIEYLKRVSSGVHGQTDPGYVDIPPCPPHQTRLPMSNPHL